MQGVDHNKGCTEHLIGAFVTSVKDAELLYQAGIPYWFVHSVRNVLRIRVNKLAGVASPLLKPCDLGMPGSSVIYEGPASIVAQHNTVMKCSNTGLSLSFNVFKESATFSSPAVASDNVSGPIRNQLKKGNRHVSHFPVILIFCINLTTRQKGN